MASARIGDRPAALIASSRNRLPAPEACRVQVRETASSAAMTTRATAVVSGESDTFQALLQVSQRAAGAAAKRRSQTPVRLAWTDEAAMTARTTISQIDGREQTAATTSRAATRMKTTSR